MKFIIGVVISILIFALFYFMAISYVKFDAGVKYVKLYSSCRRIYYF